MTFIPFPLTVRRRPESKHVPFSLQGSHHTSHYISKRGSTSQCLNDFIGINQTSTHICCGHETKLANITERGTNKSGGIGAEDGEKASEV